MACGVTARNREQNFALNLLMDPECGLVTLTGSAGTTSKTLMTLAAAPSQVLDDPRYTEGDRDPRDRAGGRRHWLACTEEKNVALDGRPGRQPGIPVQYQRQQCGRMGSRRHQ